MKQSKIKSIRLQLRYSISEMAESLGLKKATYQHYDDGSRSTPEAILCAAKAELLRCQLWAKRYVPGGAFDKELVKEYPFGIRSEIS